MPGVLDEQGREWTETAFDGVTAEIFPRLSIYFKPQLKEPL